MIISKINISVYLHKNYSHGNSKNYSYEASDNIWQ